MGFALKTGSALRIGGKDVRQNLDGNVAAKFGVPGTIHFTHPPGAERRLDFVWPEPRAWSEGHEWRDYSALPALLQNPISTAHLNVWVANYYFAAEV